jgi:class 3 adenylate cyclase/DNA-binding response OmpR family regulator
MINKVRANETKADILIVDDNRPNLRLLTDLLSQIGYNVRTASNARLALAEVETSPPDLILLDILLPDMDGYRVCEQLKADERTRDIPILFMSGLNEVFNRVKAFSVGGVDYIAKPFHVPEVLARLKTHLALRVAQKELQEKNAALHQSAVEKARLFAEEQHQRQIAESLRQVAATLSSSLDHETVLVKIMEELSRVVAYDSGAIFLKEGNELVLVTGAGIDQGYVGYRVSLDSMLPEAQVFNRQQPYIIADVRTEPNWQNWTEADPVRGWMGAPLLLGSEAIGILTTDSFEVGSYHEEDAQILQSFANHAAIAIQNAQLRYLQDKKLEEQNEILQRINQELRQLSQAYERFVPREFLRFLGRNSIVEVGLGDQVQAEITILFSDIRSFTNLSEQMTPQENFNFINAYLSRVSPVIRQHGGFIDKYIGDAVMAIFPETANQALQAAIEMQHSVTGYNERRQQKGRQPIKIGIGLHTGSVMLGTIGEVERMESTVISDAVNLAARMEGLTKVYGAAIVVSEQTLFGVERPNQYNFRFLDKVQVKGKEEAVSVFEILDGNSAEVIELKLKTRTDFEMGLLHYHSQEFREAGKYFEQVYRHNPADEAAHLYLQRSNHFAEYGVPPDWSGIFTLTNP